MATGVGSVNHKRKLIFSILTFLNDEMNSSELDSDSKESLEVATQCLENVYSVSSTNPEDRRTLFTQTPLPSIFSAHLAESEKPVSVEDKAEAERLKNEGNALMKAESFTEAVQKYSQAIELDPHNAVYYSNKAAAHSKMGNHSMAIEDCEMALRIDDKYSKAFGRMGLAYSEMEQFDKAIHSYTKALQLDPDNDSYKNNLKVAQELSASKSPSSRPPNMPTGPTLGGIDLNSILGGGGLEGLSGVFNNPEFVNMATTMLQDPQIRNALTSAVQQNSGSTSSSTPSGAGDPPNMSDFLQIGQRLAEQIERDDPERVARLREQFGGMNSQNPPGSDPDAS